MIFRINKININHRVTEGTERIGRRAAAPPSCLRGQTLLEMKRNFCEDLTPSTTPAMRATADLNRNNEKIITTR